MERQVILTMMVVMIVTLMTKTTTAQGRIKLSGASGSDVVEQVVDVVHSSCIMPQDYFLLRRLAYVESHDGTDSSTFRPGFYGGIWQVTQSMYDQTKYSSDLDQLRRDIYSNLQIQWSTTTWHDLEMPLYSGLAAALYISHTLQGQDFPEGIQAQENYWNRWYNHGSRPSTDFSNLASTLQQGCEANTKVDVVFVVDTSSSISNDDFVNAKNFIINTSSAFNLTHNVGRVGLITFSDRAEVRVNLAQEQTFAQFAYAVGSLQYTPGNTETARALNVAGNLFQSQSRNDASKVLVLITDGQSHDSIDTAHAAAQLSITIPGILVLSVGVGNQVDQNELHTIATDPPCQHTFQVASYNEIHAIRGEIQRMTCRAPLTLLVGHNVTCEVGSCPPYVVERPPGAKVIVKVTTTCSTSQTLYGSYTNPYPDSHVHQQYVSVVRAHPGFFTLVPNTLSVPAYYYINLRQPYPNYCTVTLTATLSQLRVECIENEHPKTCTPQDIREYQRETGTDLCTI